ncbi:MAG: cupredoxin domain-containing protein [Chloroflexi bacterium]|nr:cupredoxin domain-containing protein [Chloroflexota bacterium]
MVIKALVVALLIMGMTLAGCSRGAEVEVSMKDFAFTPREVSIKVGDRVTWVNDDIEPHTATTEAWDSGAINPGQNYSRTFDTPGTFKITCQFHPDMIGQVTVTARGR